MVRKFLDLTISEALGMTPVSLHKRFFRWLYGLWMRPRTTKSARKSWVETCGKVFEK
jgi:hypothetical protein